MRNWNVYGRVKASYLSCSLLITYEELKQKLSTTEAAYPAGLLITYEELKQFRKYIFCYRIDCLLITYEELKRFAVVVW